jgi:hypothetical protein
MVVDKNENQLRNIIKHFRTRFLQQNQQNAKKAGLLALTAIASALTKDVNSHSLYLRKIWLKKWS